MAAVGRHHEPQTLSILISVAVCVSKLGVECDAAAAWTGGHVKR